MDFRDLLRRTSTRYLLGTAVAGAALVGAFLLPGRPAWSGLLIATASAASVDTTAADQDKAKVADPLAAESVELTPDRKSVV